MSTPLYKRLKQNGTSFYAFPGASEDISAAYQNENLKMYFSKYVLLDLPKENLLVGTYSSPVYWDFDQAFFKSNLSTPTSTYSERLIESLRNYVANKEVVIKESKINNNENYYNNLDISTPTEKIFWKWCKKLNIIDLEPASSSDEYFPNLQEFERRDLTDDNFLPEILWRERKILNLNIVNYYQSINPLYPTNLVLELNVVSNLKQGDIVEIIDETNYTSGNIQDSNSNPIIDINFTRTKVLFVESGNSTIGDKVIVEFLSPGLAPSSGYTGKLKLIYNRLVKYIGEVNGVNNVQQGNKSYTEVWAHIPDNSGQTPDILFRTKVDSNYKPGLFFPILPQQIQPQIVGAQNFTNPIVSSPQNYPGDYFGQFDLPNYTYTLSNGDQLRRSGDYFGQFGDINTTTFNSNNIDGLSIDFNIGHYKKMNSVGNKIKTFEHFNQITINNQPPEDFEFNAILWYYTIVDQDGNSTENLYGISILDNPDNNPVSSQVGIKVPTYKKLVSKDGQDGVSYAFSLNLNFLIENENLDNSYNPEAINSLFSFNLYNEAMRKLSLTNEAFLKIVTNQIDVENKISDLRQIAYTQTDIQSINRQIENLNRLLKLYSTQQIASSNSIEARNVLLDGLSFVSLKNIDTLYEDVQVIRTSNMYSGDTRSTIRLNVPKNKDFFIKILNDDINSIKLKDGERLRLTIDGDLSFKQSFNLKIDSSLTSTQNKKIDLFLKWNGIETLLIDNLDLPVFFNTLTNSTNSSYNWKDFNFEIDYNRNITLDSDLILEVPFLENSNLINNSINVNDQYRLDDFIIGTSSKFDFSGQYEVVGVGATNSCIYLDLSDNEIVSNYTSTYPLVLNNNSNYLLSSKFKIRLNKGIDIKVTKVSDNSNNTTFEDSLNFEIRYL